MTAPTDQRVATLLTRHGRTFADEMGIDLDDAPTELFQLLVGALLMSARIDSGIALSAARALFDHDLTTPQRMAEASWQERVDALGEGNYVRYDESTASYLGDTAELLLERYDGDLRRVRAAADGDLGHLRSLLKDCKGIGDVGASIFLREVQSVWGEVYPFADDAALDPARRLGLADSERELAGLVPRGEFPRLVSALVRAERADDLEAVAAGDTTAGSLSADQLQRLTTDELYELAQRRDVAGRSSMTKDELVAALAAEGSDTQALP